MLIIVALGGNALLRRGEAMTSANQRHNVRTACRLLAPLATDHRLVISHGNGPQVGLLALQGAAYTPVATYPLDVLGAETQGMIGYLVAQEMRNLTPADTDVACLLTMIEVDANDPAFEQPTKPIGPIYDSSQADDLAEEYGWTFHADGDAMRRVVASPAPVRVVELRQIQWMLDQQAIVICAGGGGIPCTTDQDGHLSGIECVIDKDHASRMLATDLDADLLVLATDADAVYLNWGTADAAAITTAHPDALVGHSAEFGAGSMRPKVDAACDFARRTGKRAVIGSLTDIDRLVAGAAGTTISTEVSGINLRPSGTMAQRH